MQRSRRRARAGSRRRLQRSSRRRDRYGRWRSRSRWRESRRSGRRRAARRARADNARPPRVAVCARALRARTRGSRRARVIATVDSVDGAPFVRVAWAVMTTDRVLNYNHLHYFHVAANAGSLAAAAVELGVKQPTVSEQLRALERALEVSL